GQVFKPVETPAVEPQPPFHTDDLIVIDDPEPPPPITVRETFASSTTRWVETSYDFEAQTVTRSLRLDETQMLSASFNQTSRERGSDSFTQGNDGTELTQGFTLGSGTLDLAIVV